MSITISTRSGGASSAGAPPQLAVSVRSARLQKAQERFIPHQFLQSLEMADIVDVEVGDHKLKEVSIFFSDIWGFTQLVEHLEATGERRHDVGHRPAELYRFTRRSAI